MLNRPHGVVSHAQYNHDIRNVRLPDCPLVVGALGRAFDRDGIWDTRWPLRLRHLLRRGRYYGPRSMSAAATFWEAKEFSKELAPIPESPHDYAYSALEPASSEGFESEFVTRGLIFLRLRYSAGSVVKPSAAA
jgi:hypothetical protein